MTSGAACRSSCFRLGGFDASFWQLAGYVSPLADAGLRCVPVNPRGLGGSTRPLDAGGYRVRELAADVLAVANRIGVERFAVWGASFGGAVAMVLGAEQSDRVAAVVLSGMCPLFDYSGLRATWAELARLTRESSNVADVLGHVCDAEGVPGDHWVRAADYGNAEVVAHLFEGLLHYDWDSRVTPRTFAPSTLVVLGELENAEGVTVPVVEAMPDARRVALPGVGHVRGLIDTNRVLAVVQPFLATITADPRPR